MTPENTGEVFLCAPQSRLTTGPADYRYGEAFATPPEYENSEILDREYWGYMKELLAGSFVLSSGRQYDQFNAQVLGAMELRYRGIEPDYEVFDSAEVLAAVRSRELPTYHTKIKAPQDVAAQIAGVYHFWWLAQIDAIRLINEPGFVLPDRFYLDYRYDKVCGVPLGETSSTTWEEMSALGNAFEAIRTDLAVPTMHPDDFAFKHCLPSRLGVLVHWATHRRPRQDRGEDKFEPKWRTAVMQAAQQPEQQRGLYDQILIREARAMQSLLTMSPDELEMSGYMLLRWRHERVVELINANRPPDEKLDTILDGIQLPAEDEMSLAG